MLDTLLGVIHSIIIASGIVVAAEATLDEKFSHKHTETAND